MDARFTTLSGVRLDGRALLGVDAHFARIDGVTCHDADLSGVRARSAEVFACEGDRLVADDADVGFARVSRSRFRGVRAVRAGLDDTVLVDVDVSGGVMPGASMCRAVVVGLVAWNTNMSHITATDSSIRDSLLGGLYAPYSTWNHTTMTGTTLIGADLHHATLTIDAPGINLAHTNLRHATLDGANLAGANLTGADLSAATLIGTNLAGADLSAATLTGVDLSTAITA